MGKRVETNEKYCVERIGNWYYPRGYDEVDEESFETGIKGLFDFVIPSIYHLYMTKSSCTKTKKLKWQKGDTVPRYFLKSDIVKILKEGGLPKMIRIEDSAGATSCIQFIHEDDTTFRAFIVNSYPDDSAYMNLISFDMSKKSSEFVSPVFGGFFKAPSESVLLRTIDIYIKENGVEMAIVFIRIAIDAILNNQIEERLPIHTKNELQMYKEAIEFMEGNFYTPKRRMIHRFIRDEIQDSSDYVFEKDFDWKVPEFIIPKYNVKEIPEISLSAKEWKFIDEYIDEKKLLGLNITNVRPYVTNPRYGNMYIMDTYMDENDEVQRKLLYRVDVHGNDMDLWAVDRINSSTSMYVRTKVRDIEHFEMTKLFDDVEVAIVNNNMLSAPVCVEDIDSTLVNFDKSFTLVFVTMLHNFLACLIIMHDRPTRTRMVRCEYQPRNHTGKSKPRKDPGYHTVRLLKTVSDAKKLVNLSNSDGTRKRSDAIYMLEEWERVGHYRTTKTGKTIWISPTTCKRHLELGTTKEIKIKL